MSHSSRGPLRIGTRGSALALWQAHHVEALIKSQPGAPQVELIRIRTEGDVRTDVPLWQIRGRAFFTTPETLGSLVLVDFIEQKRAMRGARHLRGA